MGRQGVAQLPSFSQELRATVVLPQFPAAFMRSSPPEDRQICMKWVTS
jgi:hypothetical protein